MAANKPIAGSPAGQPDVGKPTVLEEMAGRGEMGGKVVTVALAGQPNVGKSTVFNLLTGLSQHVGNWPGKTIERKVGRCSQGSLELQVVDLPGTYSLTANSAEEVIAREYIIRERPDVVVAVLNAALLERSLYLVAELLPLPSPVVVALNMVDVAEQEGIHIEPKVLEAALGVPVVPMVAAKNRGTRELLETIEKVARRELTYDPHRPEIRADHREVMGEIQALIDGHVPEPYSTDWISLKLLEGDGEITDLMARETPPEKWDKVQAILRAHEDAMVAVASGRYDWIGRMVRAAMVKPRVGQISLTERIDRRAAHPFWGLLILAAIVGAVFWVTYALATPLQDLIDIYIIRWAAGLAVEGLASAPAWVAGLAVDGIIGGVGTVITFLPILLIFFAALSLLEDVGYMARAAFVMDRFMHLMGLHGKSFLPLFLGFGCNVPAVMGARVVESERGRLLTILLAPLMPCTARLAVLAFLAPAFFGDAAFWVSWGLVGMSLAVLALLGIAVNRLVLGGGEVAFVMELPLYHVPNWRTIGMLVWQRAVAFFRRAGTIILIVSVAVWALSWLPTGEIETSYLAQLGHLLTPLGALMGMDWRMMVALLTSFAAKENSIATLGILYGAGEEAGLTDLLARTLTPATGLAFLVVQMLFIPCVATVATVRQETDSWKWTIFDVAMLFLVSIAAGILAYQVASRFV